MSVVRRDSATIQAMRIVLDATPLLGRQTGIGRYTHHLLAALPAALERADIDAQVDVCTWTARGGRLVGLPAGVRQVGPPVPARALRAAWARSDHPRIETLVGRCDVFHGTNFVSPPTRAAREVVTIHDLTYELLRETVSADSAAYRGLVRRALSRGARVLTDSAAVAAQVRDFYGLDVDRVTPAPLGVDEGWFAARPLSAEALARIGVPSSYLLFVGSRDPRKNLFRLVEAHRRARAIEPTTPALVLAGPAGREEGLPVHEGLVRTGWVDDDALRGLVAGASALVLPSLDEGFGLPALEALACGRPVVAADLPALREVTGTHAVLADPLDVDDLARALVHVGSVPDGPSERAHRREHAAAWTWARCADATVQAYRS